MKRYLIILIILVSSFTGCVTQFFPDVGEKENYLVVEGLITDQPGPYKIRISSSWPIDPDIYKPSPQMAGYMVYVTDDLGRQYNFAHNHWQGGYFSDPLSFRGEVGRKYILHINSQDNAYVSKPMELKAVPAISNLTAEIIQNNNYGFGKSVPGYQVYVGTYDSLKKSTYYRWNFTETWEFRIPYVYETIVNRTCWKTAYSDKIYIKSTSLLTEDRVVKNPLNFITTETDRLKVKYSVLVRQFSLTEDEYNYWEKIQRLKENVGSIYDVTPFSVESNISSVNNPNEKILGFFSVSSVSEKRLFIKNTLTGFPDFYKYCPLDTVPAKETIPGLGSSIFIIEKLIDNPPPYGSFVITNRYECVDCTGSGSNIRPSFWNESKSDVVIQNELK